LRKEIDLPEKPTEALLAVVADNSFELRVNGKTVARGKDFNKPSVVKLTPFLVKGKNVFKATATNDSPEKLKEAESPDNPAGFWLLASIRTAGKEFTEIKSDSTWQARKTGDEAWEPAFEVGETGTAPWNLTAKLGSTKKRFTFRFDHVRAVWVNRNILMTALGRPNREQVVTNRISPATMLQMLELTNGKALATLIEQGAQKWTQSPALQGRGSQALVDAIYRESLGRAPSEQELSLSLDLVGSPPREQGVQDLLWSLMMLPEFQLIY
jgi:hypothetical protein